MSDGESASIQFEEETDDDTVDFHTEVDNQSIISQRVANAGGRSSRRAASPAVSNTPKTQATPPATQQQSAPLVASVPSQPVAAPQATVVTPATKSAATDTDTSDDEVDPDASPRMMTTSTGKLNRGGAAAEKKTVVSATLRARAASQARGRSPNVSAPETAVTSVPRSAPLAQSSSSSASHTAAPATSSPPAVRGASPVGDAVPNVPMGATTTLDAAGVAALLQFISAGQQSHRGGSPQPQLGSNAGAVASAIETAQIATLNYETLQRHIQTQQQLQVPPVAPHATVSAVTANGPQLATNAAPLPLQQSPGLTPQALASSRARRIAASNDIVASAPPTELADDAREEAARITLGWYRDFNGEQRKQLQALEARVREEKFALQSDMMAFRDRKASEAQQRTFAADAAVREREQLHTTTRAASKKQARAASAHPAAPSPRVEAPPRPVALEPSLEAVVRGVASRYGVVLPAPNLTGSTETAVSLPDRLFFATGVQLTRDQRNELLVKMREAIRLRGSGTSAPNAVGPVPWLAPVDTELGSRAASLPRAALDNKTRISMSPGRGVLAGASAERPSPPDSMPRGVSVADWTPFTGPMRQRTREGGPAAIPRQTSTQQRIADVGGPRPRKRTEVLRDIFLLLDVRNRKLLRRAEMELLYQELSLEDESRRADDLKYSKASARLHRDLTLRFVVEYVLPLMLLSGFEEFDFPLFSQIILRMADKVALPTDFAFQPTAQSPLASRGRRGESLGEVDIASTSQAVTEYLRALCAVPSA